MADDKRKRKLFIIDTNVILYDISCVYNFADHDIILPVTVLNELDYLKNGNETINHDARHFIELIDKLPKNNEGYRAIPDHGKLIVKMESEFHQDLRNSFDPCVPDNRILNIAYHASKEFPDRIIVLVSKDKIFRLKAESIRIQAMDYVIDDSQVTKNVRDKRDNSMQMKNYKPSEEMKERMNILLKTSLLDQRMLYYLLYWRYTEKDFLRVIEAAEKGDALEVLREYGYITKKEEIEGYNYSDEQSDNNETLLSHVLKKSIASKVGDRVLLKVEDDVVNSIYHPTLSVEIGDEDRALLADVGQSSFTGIIEDIDSESIVVRLADEERHEYLKLILGNAESKTNTLFEKIQESLMNNIIEVSRRAVYLLANNTVYPVNIPCLNGADSNMNGAVIEKEEEVKNYLFSLMQRLYEKDKVIQSIFPIDLLKQEQSLVLQEECEGKIAELKQEIMKSEGNEEAAIEQFREMIKVASITDLSEILGEDFSNVGVGNIEVYQRNIQQIKEAGLEERKKLEQDIATQESRIASNNIKKTYLSEFLFKANKIEKALSKLSAYVGYKEEE